MERYANRGGNSNVVSYEITSDSITVLFSNGGLYLFNSIRPGAQEVSHMHVLAKQGQGLNSYIKREINKNYYQKIR